MNQKKCLVTGCYRVGGPALRGMCHTCYSKAKKKVDAGEVTWERLAELGLCEPSAGPFDTAFNRAVSDQRTREG